jgi:molecular chaperone DnaJ
LANKKDFYSLLNVSRTATADEIKKSYRKLAMQFHPDKNPGDKKAEEKFKEITEAYETLSDQKKRDMYDQFGHAGAQFGGGGAGGPFGGAGGFGGFGGQGPGGAGPGGAGANGDPFQDIFGDMFGEIFGAGRGAGAGGARQRRQAKGTDLRYTLNISFEESALGCEKVISFVRQRGSKEDQAKLAVNVPAGVKEGQRLKLAGEGDSSGGSAGDLYVIVSIQDHALFKRNENDVTLDLPITFTDAILGTNIEVPTLTGKAMIRIPPGTHTGQIFRLKGKGFPKVGGFGAGDMLVKVLVDTPSNLSTRQKELVEELSKSTETTPLVKSFQEKVSNLMRTRK